MPKGKRKKVEPEVQYFYGPHMDDTYRWWRSIDGHDQFDIIDKVELDRRINRARDAQRKVYNHLPGFCDDDSCKPCKPYK